MSFSHLSTCKSGRIGFVWLLLIAAHSPFTAFKSSLEYPSAEVQFLVFAGVIAKQEFSCAADRSSGVCLTLNLTGKVDQPYLNIDERCAFC